jgi:hypothetical protein
MKVTLNTDKASLLFISGLPNLTVDEPGPIDVNVDTLTRQQAGQLLMSVNLGKVTTDVDFLELFKQKFVSPEVLAKMLVKPAPKVLPPIEEKEFSVLEKLVADKERWKNLLSQSIPSIKKQLPSFSSTELLSIKNVETNGKKRARVLEALDQLIDKFFAEVKANIPDAPPLPDEPYSTNVSDVVESNVENVTFTIPEE